MTSDKVLQAGAALIEAEAKCKALSEAAQVHKDAEADARNEWREHLRSLGVAMREEWDKQPGEHGRYAVALINGRAFVLHSNSTEPELAHMLKSGPAADLPDRRN